MNLIEREKKAIFQTYKRLAIEVEYAEGCRIYDKDGNAYLDFLAGIAVNTLGYNHHKINEAIQKQLKKYLHISNFFYQEPQIILAEKLINLSGYKRVFFTNSGTEAIEGTVKLIRRWGSMHGKNEIVSFSGGFHGRTYAALSLMDKPHYKAEMGPFLDGFRIVEYNNIEALRNVINENTAAVFIEFLQGEGGVSSANTEFVKTIAELKDELGFLLVADEIQSGVGRTGKFFAFEHYNIKPDVVTLAKGIGGGLPLGCMLSIEELNDVWEAGMHGSTFGGNALACAAGIVVLDEIENGLIEKVINVSNYLFQQLCDVKKEFPNYILEIRGRGLLLGLLLSFDASLLVKRLLENNVITNAASGNVLRLLPPLIIGNNEVDEFMQKLRKSLKDSF